MQEGRAIALWTVLLGGGFIGAVWLLNDPPKFGTMRPAVPVSRPAPNPPSPAITPVPVQPVPDPPPAAQPRLPEPAVGTVPAAEPPAPRTSVIPAEPPAVVQPPPIPPAARAPAEPRVPPAATAARPAPDFPVIPPGPKSGDNIEARRYTDALNALSTEGYSGVDRIVPEGDQFRATAIMEGQRFEVLVDPDSGQVWRLSRPR